MSKTTIFFLFWLGLATTGMAQVARPLINSASLSPDGTLMAFSYQGDIWTANADGSLPRRITIHEGYETLPIWTRDGLGLIFKSDRNGNGDIFYIDSQGGIPRQLTHHSDTDTPSGLTADGQVLFYGNRNYQQIEWDNEIQVISLQGGTPYRYLDALGKKATQSPNGRFTAFVKGSCRIEREAYNGPANKNLWLYDAQSNTYSQLTTDPTNDTAPQWGDDQTLYFQSARSGRYNVHRMKIDDKGQKQGEIEAVTAYTDMGITSFSVGNAGKDLLIQKADQLFRINTADQTSREINLSLGTDYRFDPVERKKFSNNVSQIVPSPNGKYSALVIRGEIFITENDKEKDKTVNLTNSPYLDSEPQWVNDSTLLFVSDRGGNYDIYAVRSDDKNQGDLFKTLKLNIRKVTDTPQGENNLAVAPDRKKICYSRGNGILITASLSKNGDISNEIVLQDGWADAQNISWSPDSRWLAYNQQDLYFNDEIFIQRADGAGGAPVNISMHPKMDAYPVWSADGSKLVFASARSNNNYDIWFLWLKKSDWEKTADEWKYEDAPKVTSATVTDTKKNKKGKSSEETESAVQPIQIDFENIHERLQQVTSFFGNETTPQISKDGQTIYYRTDGDDWGKPAKVDYDLYKISWEGKDHKAITTGSAKPSYLFMDDRYEYIYTTLKGGKPARFKLSDDKQESLPISAQLHIDFKEELNQIFEEACMALKQNFYDPDFHGQNFDQLKATYKPLVMKASTREDFNYTYNQMLGQFNASHMGLYRGDTRKETQSNTTGLIGVALKPVSDGVQVIGKLPEMPADREISKIAVGETITAVNGTSIGSDINYYQLMNNTAGDRVLLTVKNMQGLTREVEIRPVSSNSDARYKAWIQEKQKLVDQYSNGQLGYIHIKAMGWTSFERFERALTAAGYGKKGIVIDVRFNGGGWTTDYVMAILSVKQHAYTIPRGAATSLKDNKQFEDYYPYAERLPLPAWTRPSIALCNESSYSNAEIFSHAYKQLGIGTLVGKPTFGAVISTGAKTLIDGSYVRLPFRAWYVKATGENMELGPAVPDILLDNAPDEKGKGQDSQLKKAVEQLMSEIAGAGK